MSSASTDGIPKPEFIAS